MPQASCGIDVTSILPPIFINLGIAPGFVEESRLPKAGRFNTTKVIEKYAPITHSQ
jgi:hypothetical protein